MTWIFGWDYGSNFPRGGIFQLIAADGFMDLMIESNWHKKGKRNHKKDLAAKHKKKKKRRRKKIKIKRKKEKIKKRRKKEEKERIKMYKVKNRINNANFIS